MPFRVGQRVAAAQTLGAFGDIRRGPPGTVVSVSYLGAYDVKFIGGRAPETIGQTVGTAN
jgi:ADP-ribose pyrophosphatase YjhB (NUDIX family)